MVNKTRLCILALFLIFTHIVSAQNKDKELIDSLIRLLPAMREDSAKVNVYAQVMLTHVYYKPIEGISYINTSLELARKINWDAGIAKIHHRAGRLYWRAGNFEEALIHHKQALELYNKTGDKHAIGRVLIEIGQDYLDNGKLPEAKRSLTEALKFNEAAGDLENMATTYDILTYLYDVEGNPVAATETAFDYLKLSEKTGDKTAIAHSAHMLASNYQVLGNNEEALKYFRKGLEVSKKTGNTIEQINFYTSIADLYLEAKNYQQASDHYFVALKLATEIGDAQILGYIFRRTGHYYRAIGDLSEALNNYINSERSYKSISNKQDLAGLYSDIGAIYTRLKKYDHARKYLIEAKKLYDDLDIKMSMSDFYLGSEKLDSATGNWENAYHHYKEYITIRDSIYNKESLQKLVASQLIYDNERKEAIVKAEREKKDLLAKEEIKRQLHIRNASFVVLFAVLVFSIILLFQRNKLAKEKKRVDHLLKDKELLLREIHHRVKNNLEIVSSLLELQSAQISDTQTKDAMLESQNRVQSIGIVHQKLYRGDNLGAIEMKDYFIHLSESILDSFGAEKRVTIDCIMEKLDVDIDTAVPLGLIVNELLTNTLKYAFPGGQPGKVIIKLQKQKDGVLHLEVSDNGIGKNGITKGTGFGGQLVMLLTQQLSGTFKEEVGKGTKIYFEFKAGKAA